MLLIDWPLIIMKLLQLDIKKEKWQELQLKRIKIIYNDVDTVTVYLNPKRQKPFYDYIVSLKPKRVIFNPGTENPEFYSILKDNNIPFEESCTLVLLSTNQY